MSAPAEPLKPSLDEARSLAALERRVDELLADKATLHNANEVLRGQLADRTFERDAARQNVDRQQDECQTHRPRLIPLPRPRPTRDVATGESL